MLAIAPFRYLSFLFIFFSFGFFARPPYSIILPSFLAPLLFMYFAYLIHSGEVVQRTMRRSRPLPTPTSPTKTTTNPPSARCPPILTPPSLMMYRGSLLLLWKRYWHSNPALFYTYPRRVLAGPARLFYPCPQPHLLKLRRPFVNIIL